jgi:hypothetical protein
MSITHCAASIAYSVCLAHGITMIATEFGDDQFTKDAGRSSRDGVDALIR